MAKFNQEFDEDELLGELEITKAGADAGDDPEASKKKETKNVRAADAWKEYLKEGESDKDTKAIRLAKDRWRKEERKKAHKTKKGTKHS